MTYRDARRVLILAVIIALTSAGVSNLMVTIGLPTWPAFFVTLYVCLRVYTSGMLRIRKAIEDESEPRAEDR
jgi:hypothetical protein